MAAIQTSRHRNVYWHGRAQKWAACVKVDGRNQHIGTYDTDTEAADAVAAWHARQRTDWPARMVESLAESKREGRSFAVAWRIALRDNPPRARDVGRQDGTLFDEGGQAEVSLVDAFEGYCHDAWHGEKPGLRNFSLDLLSPPDWSRPAIVRQAA